MLGMEWFAFGVRGKDISPFHDCVCFQLVNGAIENWKFLIERCNEKVSKIVGLVESVVSMIGSWYNPSSV